MATRFYATPGAAAAVNPTPHAVWDQTTDLVRRALSTTKTNQTAETLIVIQPAGIADYDVLAYQLVSPAIATGPIGGTFASQFYAYSPEFTFYLRSQAIIKVVSNDGATTRGTLYAGDFATLAGNPNDIWNTTAENRKFPRYGASLTLTPVNAQQNDRVVVEIGYRQHGSSNTTGQVSIDDEVAPGDLPNLDGGITTGATWVEFSENLFTARAIPIMRTSILE